MPLRSDQVERLKKKFPGLLVNEQASVIDCAFGVNVALSDGVEMYMSTVGDFSYVAPGTSVCWTDIGKYSSIGPSSFVGMAAHPARGFVSTHPIFYLSVPERNLTWAKENYFDGTPRTTIGHDVWIGGNVSVKAGVTIGDGAIIGAGAVVTKDVEPYAVMAGVPARKLRGRFTPEQTEFLKAFRWWDRDADWLREHHMEFHDIDAFMANFGNSDGHRGTEALRTHRAK